MARKQGDPFRRPDQVIMLDAADPLTEIHGRFVWQEEHDRVVETVRRQAFEDGYQSGSTRQTKQGTTRRRRRVSDYARLVLLVLLTLLVLLMLPVVLGSG